MKIQIEDWTITSDVHCWTVRREKTNEKGKVSAKFARYYPSLEQAFIGLAEIMIRVSDARGIEECLSEVRRVKNLIEDEFKKVGIDVPPEEIRS